MDKKARLVSKTTQQSHLSTPICFRRRARVLNFRLFKQSYWYKVSCFKSSYENGKAAEWEIYRLLFNAKRVEKWNVEAEKSFWQAFVSTTVDGLCDCQCKTLNTGERRKERNIRTPSLHFSRLNISQAFPFHCSEFFINSALYNI